MGSILLLTLQAGAQTKTPKTDSIKREDSLRKERAARADVFVSGKNIISNEPAMVNSTEKGKKTDVQRKRKGCRKNRH